MRANNKDGKDLPVGRAVRSILIVSHYFWPEEFRVNELATALLDRGHRVTVVTGTPNYPAHRMFASYRQAPRDFAIFGQSIPVVRFPMISIGNSKIGLIANYLSLPLSILLLAPFKLRRQRFDVVLCFQPSPFTSALSALFLARVKRAPLILWVLDCWPETLEALGLIKNPRVVRMAGALVGAVYRRCAAVLGQSKSFGDSIRKWSRVDNFRHFPNWVEDIYLESPVVREGVSCKSDLFTIVFAGNIGEAQDFQTLLEAIEWLRDMPIRWIIVGSGRMANWLKDEVMARQLSDRVTLTGRRPSSEMPALFAHADALLVSLASQPIFAMTIPGKVQSYMAAGRPILGALDGEGKRLIEEAGCGITAPAGDASALAAAVCRMLGLSKKERDAMGRRGQSYASLHFNRDRLIDSLEQWMEEVIP